MVKIFLMHAAMPKNEDIFFVKLPDKNLKVVSLVLPPRAPLVNNFDFLMRHHHLACYCVRREEEY